ncbi:hypothetical protein AB1N83_009085 [Pleurotus pulmonarius]
MCSNRPTSSLFSSLGSSSLYPGLVTWAFARNSIPAGPIYSLNTFCFLWSQQQRESQGTVVMQCEIQIFNLGSLQNLLRAYSIPASLLGNRRLSV